MPARSRSTTMPSSAPELRAMRRTGLSRAFARILRPVRSSPSASPISASTAPIARRSASPPPGTMPSATAAFIEEMASSNASFRFFISASDGAPTRITATPPESFASRFSSCSRS